MEIWISDIESMFQEGLTDIHFPSDQWAALSSKNSLKTDLLQYTSAMTGLPVMMGMNGQPTTMLGALLAGENPLKFSYVVVGPNLLYELGILTFSSMATYGRPIAKVNGELITNEEQVNGFITEGEELSPDEVTQLINYLKNTDLMIQIAKVAFRHYHLMMKKLHLRV